MQRFAFSLALLVLLMGVAFAILPAPSFFPISSPWMDTSMCPATDSLMVCQLKKGQCSPISTIFSPPGGPVKAITTCSNSTGVVLGPQFFMSIGLAFVSGKPETLADKATTDPAAATAIRRCALNATGLLNSDMLTLNRTAVAAKVSAAFATPALGDAIAAATNSCPEPVNYKTTDFMACLRKACMDNVAVSPFMSMATNALSGLSSPPTAPMTPLKTDVSAAKANLASAAVSMGVLPGGGASAYPYAGGAGAFMPKASGAGMFPYAGWPSAAAAATK